MTNYAPSAIAAETQTFKIGAIENYRDGLVSIPLLIAQRKGFFTQQGLDVEIVWYKGELGLNSMWNMFDRAAKGEIALFRTSPPYLMDRVLKGGDFAAILSDTVNPVHTLMSGPDIKTFGDLKGKTVALTLPDNAITIATRRMMALHGIGPNDVTIKTVAGTQARVDCVKSGECAAATVDLPAVSALAAQGYHRLGISNEGGPLVFEVEVVNRAWARAHPKLFVSYVRAMAAALRYANDPKNDDDMLKLIMETVKGNDATARDILRFYRDPKYSVLSREGEIDTKAFADMIALEGQYGLLPKPLPKVEQFIDQSYLIAAGIK